MSSAIARISSKKQAKHLAKNFNAQRQETHKAPFKFNTVMQCRDVGQGETIVDYTPDVEKGSLTFNGWKAGFIWRMAYWGM